MLQIVSMRPLLLALSSVTASAVLCLGLAAPVSAAPSVDGGEALVRLTAPSASVGGAESGTRILTIQDDAAGSWFGERTLTSGKRALRGGTFLARKLVGAWKGLGYGSDGVMATLTWDEGGGSQAALVRVRKPRIVGDTLLIPLDTTAALPEILTNPSINLRRAPGKTLRSFPVNATVNVSGNVSVKSSVTTAAASTESLVNGSTSCTNYYLKSSLPSVNMNYLCGGVNFNNGKWIFSEPTGATSGSVRLTASISGGSTAPFTFDQIVVTWAISG